jgi:predicted transposase YbfD/YdcC
VNIAEQFLQIKSHAHKQGRTYAISSLLLLVISGLMANCNSYAAICRFGKTLSKPLLGKLGLPQAPCHSTISENMRKIDLCSLRVALETASLSLLSEACHDSAVIGVDNGCSEPAKTAVSLDGKVLRGSKRQENQALHLLGLFSHQTMCSHGETALAVGENEISAATRLLETLELNRLIVTGDAIFTQQEIVEKIVRKGADFVLAVKGNQEGLLREIKQGLERGPPESTRSWAESWDKGHGRIEKRSIEVVDMPWEYQNAWKNIAQIACITRHRMLKSKGIWREAVAEKAYIITSLSAKECTPKLLLQYNRHHWHIENKGHWVRDAVFKEDGSVR